MKFRIKWIWIRKLLRNVCFFLIIFFLNCPSKPSPKILGLFSLLSTNSAKETITVTESNSSTSVTEGGSSDSYTISLSALPSADVIVNIAFDSTQLKINGTSTSPVSLTFTTSNWNTAQTATVEAIYDSITEGTHTKTITHSSTSSDSKYNGLTISSIIVTITDTLGATVKGSFQSGNVTVAATPQLVALTTTVDSSKAFVLCNAKLDNSGIDRAITCQLNTAGTQVTIETGGGTGAVVDWYVMEYSSGATVLRGSQAFASGDTTLNATLSTSISISKTFVIAYARSTDGGNTTDGYRMIRTQLSSATNLEMARNQTGGDATVEWQVIQFDGSNVQSGIVTLGNGNTNTTATLSSAVKLTSSFLILNYKIATAIGGIERDYYVRGSYSNSSTVSFNRVGSNQDVDISWFAVEMLDGTTVQSGTATMAAGVGLSTTANLSSSVTTSKSMILFSNDTSAFPTTDSASQDSGTYTSTFNSSSQINFARNNGESNGASLDWFVVSFQ